MLFTLMSGSVVSANSKQYSNILYPETEEAINEVINEYGFDIYYFNNIIDNYLESGHTDLEELNNGLQDACNKVKDSCMATDSEYEIALNEYSSKATKAKAKSATASPYQTSLSLYSAGMLLVKAAGCTHTAESMNHAIVPESNVGTGWTPSNYYYDHDSWGTFLTGTYGFFSLIEGKFQQSVATSGKDIASFSGTYEFTKDNSSLDALTQLHYVNYSVTFVKTGTYSYSCSFLLSDVYDFDWNEYDNFAVDFGNNYCKVMQDNGYIAPFNIYIVGDM